MNTNKACNALEVDKVMLKRENKVIELLLMEGLLGRIV